MVIDSSKHTRETPIPQALPGLPSKPNKINANTTYDFAGKNLTPYGGLFPVAVMLEKLKFQQLIEETLTEASTPCHVHVPIYSEHGPGDLCWVLPLEPYPVCGQRLHADSDPEGV
jgi:hypothetical protein